MRHLLSRESGTWEAYIVESGSSFQNTDLDYQLKQRGVKHVVMAGLVANTCLEATARYAYEL